MDTNSFWNGLVFDYILTYSLLRGPKWERLQEAMHKEKQISRRLLLTATAAEMLVLRSRLQSIEQQNELVSLLTTDNNQAYNITATPVARLHQHVPEVIELGYMLQKPVNQSMYSMCAPVFRDAVAFYNAEHQLVAVLNICFGCNMMQTESGQDIEADYRVYEQLREWFLRAGHPIAG